jgi:hypothetical protein
LAATMQMTTKAGGGIGNILISTATTNRWSRYVL